MARDLIGAVLCVHTGARQSVIRAAIIETEAYIGPHDLACHASKGRTKRTEVMFSSAGTVYVYLIYGIYEMLNVVTGPKGYPAAVLLRGAGEWDGPGKLTRALGVCRSRHNGLQLGVEEGIWIERGSPVPDEEVFIGPRVGVSYAQQWAHTPLRYVHHPAGQTSPSSFGAGSNYV